MAPHSSTLAWKIPWTEEPGGLQSMGLHASSSVTDLVMNVPQKFRVENTSYIPALIQVTYIIAATS